MGRPLIGLTFAMALVAGCAVTSPASQTRFGGTLALPSVHVDAGGGCAGVGLDGVLAGNATDPRVAWVESKNGQRIDVVFPDRLGARFTPDLEIVDPNGKVVARAGDPIDGGCPRGDLPGNPVLILWP